MKILFPIKFFYPFQNGGYSQVVYWLTKSLSKQGHDTIVITTTKDLKNRHKVNEWVDVEGIKVRYCSGAHFFNIRLIINGIRKIKECETIHLTSIFFIPSFIFALTSIFFKKKIIWSTHGELAKIAIDGRIEKLLYLKLIKLVSKKITFHSTSLKETNEIRHELGMNCKIIEVPNYLELRNPLNRQKNNSIVFVGRIDPIKALDKLIKAVALSKIFVKDNYILYLIGDDKDPSTLWYVKELKELIIKLGLDSKVMFLGNIYGDRKYEYYSKAKCSLLVSETENFGNVVIESLSQGTPVIASLGTPWKVLKKENLGDYISNDPKSISKALDKILSLPSEDYNIISKECIKWSFDNYSIDNHIDDWIEIYNNL